MKKVLFNGPERRAYIRVHSHNGMKYTVLSKDLGRILKGITRSRTEDIGAGGLRFISYKKISTGSILEFKFNLPGHGRPIIGVCEVVRAKPRLRGLSYDIGLKFLWIKAANKHLIDAYVHRKKTSEILKKLAK